MPRHKTRLWERFYDVFNSGTIAPVLSFLHEKNDFAERSQILAEYRSKK